MSRTGSAATAAKVLRDKAAEQGGDIDRIGTHIMQKRVGGGWECSLCKLQGNTETSRRSLRAKPCKGDIVLQCHPSHTLHWDNGILWCGCCASYTTRQPRQLRQPCPGRAVGEARKNVLRRLREGLPPTTACYAMAHISRHLAAQEDDAIEYWVHGGSRHPARVHDEQCKSGPPW